MTNCISDIKTYIDYGNNEGEIDTNYEDENKTDYRDLVNIDIKDIDLEITQNNILLLLSQPLLRSFSHPLPYLGKN